MRRLARWTLASSAHLVLAVLLVLGVATTLGVATAVVRVRHVATTLHDVGERAREAQARGAAARPSTASSPTAPVVDDAPARDGAAAAVAAWAAGDAGVMSTTMMPALAEDAGAAPEGLAVTGPARVVQGGAALAVVVVPTSAGDVTVSMVDAGDGTWRAQSLLLAG